MQKCVFLPYTPFEIVAREYMEYFTKTNLIAKKIKIAHILFREGIEPV
jgi:hypothetical protein